MEKYCKKCGRVFDDLNYRLCPYCGLELDTRYGRQPIPRQLRHEVFKRDGYRCRECGASKDETSLEIDHIVPVAKGGTNDIDNLQTLCRECNRMKHTDVWIGGESNSSTIEYQITLKEQKISSLKSLLNNSNDENEKIDIKYQIMKLNEEIDLLNNKLGKADREDARNRLYKKLYVSESDTKLEALNSSLRACNYSTKNQFIDYLVDIDYSKETKQGKEYEASRNYKKAIECYNKVTEISKSDYIWYLKARCYYEMKDFNNSLMCCKKAIQINKLNCEVWLLKAKIYNELKNYSKMLKCYDTIIKIGYDEDRMWRHKGDYYNKRFKYFEAIECYNNAVNINPGFLICWRELYYCYKRIGKEKDAQECYKKGFKGLEFLH